MQVKIRFIHADCDFSEVSLAVCSAAVTRSDCQILVIIFLKPELKRLLVLAAQT